MNVSNIPGSVMIGPSSSHTAGAARVGKITLALLEAPAVEADIFLRSSFAKTYKGRSTDKALVAGIMGVATDDSHVRRAPELAREQGLEVDIATSGINRVHPSTVKVTLTDTAGNAVSLLGNSIGGGSILVKKVNGMKVSITGQHTTLIVLHRNAPDAIATVTETMADAGVNICNFRLSRQSRGGEAMMTIEIDGSSGSELNGKIKVSPNIFSSTMLQPIQLMRPAITGGFIFAEPEFNHSLVASTVAAAEKGDLPISAIVLRQQAKRMEQTEESIYEHVRKNYQVMTECIESGCSKDLKSTSGLTGDNAFKMRQISESEKSLTGSFFPDALYWTLTVSELSTAMGQIATIPAAGSCGILPATLLTMRGGERIPEGDCVMSLFTASTVGMVIASNASLAGIQGGCQAKYGSAAAMAAAAIVELAGDTPKIAKHAIAVAIKSVLGFVCDPIAGLMEVLCIKCNASGVAGAFMAAGLTLADIESAIPADEVVWTMKKVGDAMSSILKEIAEDGLAATPTGRHPHEHVFGTAREAHSGCSRCGGCSS